MSRPLPRPPGVSHAPLVRPQAGRLLGGVCAGFAGPRGLSVGAVRAVFLAGTLLLGLGAVVYLACWLIVPDEAEDPTAPGARGIVVLAQACGAAAGLAVLSAVGAAATIFGYGWVTVAVAGTILLAVLPTGVRLRPAWALLPVGALVLPSVALATGGVALAPVGAQALAPATLAELPAAGLRSGMEPLFVDLRRTALPRRGVIPLRVDAGIRRTIIALPHDRCVNVDVRYDVSSFAARTATVLTGRYPGARDVVSVFGGAATAAAPAGPARRRRIVGRRCASTSAPRAAGSTSATTPTPSTRGASRTTRGTPSGSNSPQRSTGSARAAAPTGSSAGACAAPSSCAPSGGSTG